MSDMWVAKFVYKHDCIVGSRQKKYSLLCHAILLGIYKEVGQKYVAGMYNCIGEEKKIKKFVNEIRRDKRVARAELNGNIVLTLERDYGSPISFYKNDIFFIKPVFMDGKGYEHWEIAALDKKILTRFITKIKPKATYFKLNKIVRTKLSSVYFPHAIPQLSENQKKAVHLAVENGYYNYPKKIDMRKLAKIMGISLSTFQEHLKKAESKLIPDLLSMNIIE